MLFNHLRKLVDEFVKGEASLCPECEGALVARKGEIVVWHWAHKAKANNRKGCSHEETAWHLKMKSAYLQFKNWEVEYPLSIAGNCYRIDAINPNTGAVREFVHSLSPHYLDKHLTLKRHGYNVLWVFDGQAFASLRGRRCRSGAIKNLLKPKANALHDEIGGIVHYENELWRHWKNDVWFKLEGERSKSILRNLQ
jgi:competence CoiA-like predicted nuclease